MGYVSFRECKNWTIIHFLKDVVATWVLFELCGAVGAVAGFHQTSLGHQSLFCHRWAQGRTGPGHAWYCTSFGGFLKWWYPTTIGFPTKSDHFGVFWGYHHLRKHPFGSRGVFVVSQYGWLIWFVYFSLWYRTYVVSLTHRVIFFSYFRI